MGSKYARLLSNEICLGYDRQWPNSAHKAATFWIDGWCSPPCLLLHFAAMDTFDIEEVSSILASLRECTQKMDLQVGIRIHDYVLHKGLLATFSDALVCMYVQCGDLVRATELFDVHSSRDPFTWTALIAAFVENGQDENAIIHYDRMQHEDLTPNAVTVNCALKACGNVKAINEGEQIHDAIAREGLLKSNIKLSNALVGMYAKCGALARARRVLKELPIRDVISWTTLIAGYVEHGDGAQALSCFEEMKGEGHHPNQVTYGCLLRACGSMGMLDKGVEFHEDICRQGWLKTNTLLGNALVDMYAKCGAFTKAHTLLDELPYQNTVSWNALIAGLAHHGENEQAIKCYKEMQHEGFSPNAVTFACILKVYGSMKDLGGGEKIHKKLATDGLLEGNALLVNALVDMYIKCDALEKAQQVLEKLPVCSISSWNALITRYAHQDDCEQALNCFEHISKKGIPPDAVTYAGILKVIASIKAVENGENIHRKIVKQGLLRNDIVLATCLVDMYAKCGALRKAHRVLGELPVRDVILWTALIKGYAEHFEGDRAIKCFEEMQSEGLAPNVVTFICSLKACGSIKALVNGEKIHDMIVKQGLLATNVMLGNALLDMYARCGTLNKALQVLKELPIRNAVSWNTMIARCVDQGENEQAMKCFEEMHQEGFSPDAITFACILKGCGSMGASDTGEKIRDEIAQHGLFSGDTKVGTALVDMYAKCGALHKARQVLEMLPIRDVVAWTAFIAGLIQQGEHASALECFEQMLLEGVAPNGATFSCLLNAFSHLGLVDHAHLCFLNMDPVYGTKPDMRHYSCMVHVFGRAGHLEMAVEVIKKMPLFSREVWNALMVACKKWGDGNIGRLAFEQSTQPFALSSHAVPNLC